MRKGFTLTELIVVVAIIIILLAAVLPLLGSTMRDAEFSSAVTRVKGMLQVAKSRAADSLSSYGVCFYVEYDVSKPANDKQHAVFVKWGGTPNNNPDWRYNVDMGDDEGSYWNAYAERFVPDTGQVYTFPGKIRVRNNTPGRPKRNVFMILFTPNKDMDFPYRHFILHDPFEVVSDPADYGNASSYGHTTGLPISDITGNWCDPPDCSDSVFPLTGDPIRNIVDLDRDDAGGDGIPWTEFDGSNSLIVYDHATWVDLLAPGDASAAENMLDQRGYPIYVGRYGDIINLERGDVND